MRPCQESLLRVQSSQDSPLSDRDPVKGPEQGRGTIRQGCVNSGGDCDMAVPHHSEAGVKLLCEERCAGLQVRCGGTFQPLSLEWKKEGRKAPLQHWPARPVCKNTQPGGKYWCPGTSYAGRRSSALLPGEPLASRRSKRELHSLGGLRNWLQAAA